MKLSVIIPFYNEDRTLNTLIEKVISTNLVYEIICVDDGSTDRSYEIISEWKTRHPELLKIIRLEKNYGKGFAIRMALEKVTGDIVLIQDADLEYDPSQYSKLIAPFENENVNVVYGSRNLLKNPRSANSFYWGGVFLSKITNLLYGSSISDESTGFKLFRSELIRELDLECVRFEFCPEVTAKILNRKIKIYETPITYTPRSISEGKKINWRDGVTAIWTLVKYKFKD
ncbi:MAG: glycosyltransferase family 2 protein [Ignavibacteria bacterium]|nr:glycosyltransferase family 2 protein [Ignavibacteria bacterium]